MNYAINILVLATLFFAGMAQAKAMDVHTAYVIAGVCGAVAFALAIVRYKRRKDAGE